MLKFSKANAKLIKLEKLTGKKVYSLGLISGFSCPQASECLTKVYERPNGTRYLKDGPLAKFRCYSAAQEAVFSRLYKSVKDNYDQLKAIKTIPELIDIIESSLPVKAEIIRIHSSGDFYNDDYFQAWVHVARNYPDKWFYAYTKSLPYWIRHKRLVENTPNLMLTASVGGRKDFLIDQYNLRYCKVLYSEYRARKEGLPIDKNDKYACLPENRDINFSLILHGVAMPKNSESSLALVRLKKHGKFQYSRG